MHVTTEELADRQRKVTVVVTDDELAQAKQDVAKALGKNARVPGYRPGSVPIDRLEARLGAEALEEEAVERLALRAVRKAVAPAEAYTAAPMSANVAGRDPFTIEVVVPLQPAVALGDYHALRVPAPEVAPIADADVEAILDGWRRDMALLTDVDRPAAAGDVVTVSLVGRLGSGGEPDAPPVFEDEALTLVLDPERFDATKLPPSIIEALIGTSAGGALDFTVTYPAFWPDAALQERPVAFTGTVARVAELQPPELDDTLAASMADVDTVAELRERVRAQLAERARMAVQDRHVEAAIDALVALADVTFPPQLLRAEISRYIHDLKAKVEKQGFEFDQWLSLQPEGAEKLYAQIETEAEQRIRRQLVLTEFCVAEHIRVKSSEIDEEVRFFSRLAGTGALGGGPSGKGKAGAGRKGQLPSVSDMRSSFGSRILSSRAVARLLAITSGAAEPVPPEPVPVGAPVTPAS